MSSSTQSAGGERDFRWRGQPWAVARVHVLFAVALLACGVARWMSVRSAGWVSAVSDAACAVLLFAAWRACLRFERRYGLEDALSRALQFAVFGACALVCYRFARAEWVNELATRAYSPDSAAQARLFALHGASFAFVLALMAALDARAWSARIQLQLDSVERVKTKSMLHFDLLVCTVIAGATVWAWTMRESTWPWPLFSLAALVPAGALHAWSTARAVERYRGKVPDAPRTR